MKLLYSITVTKGYASITFFAWGYASRKRMGTADLEDRKNGLEAAAQNQFLCFF